MYKGKLNSNFKHGMSKTKLYLCWRAMLTRCENQNYINWHRYGGRGIKVCKRWKDFRNFLEDMGVPPKRYTLERKNNDGNYTKSNCKWATMQEQALNKTFSKQHNKIGFRGVRKTPNGKYQAKTHKKYLGSYSTKEEAARAYNKEAIIQYGKKAIINKGV